MRVVLAIASAIVAAAAPLCRPGQVTMSAHCCDPAMGTNYGEVVFKNGSRSECLVYGDPAIRLSDDRGRTMRAIVERNVGLNKYGEGVTRFPLPPGGRAAITVGTIGPNFDDNRCATRMAATLLGTSVSFKTTACAQRDDPIRVMLSGFHEYEPPPHPPASAR